MSAGVCHPDTDERSRGSVNYWRHLSVCRNGAYEAPFEPEEVQQGPGVPSSDQGPLPVLPGACHFQQGHPAAYHQSLHREVLHPQAGAG